MSDDDHLIYETEPAPSAIRLTVTPATIRRAEVLGWTPGDGDVLTWALREVEDWRKQYRRACTVATALHNTSAELTTERDAARRDLARIVQLCGWDCDGNDPETPAGAIHLYADAVQAVRELVAAVNDDAPAEALAGDDTDTDTDRSTT